MNVKVRMIGIRRSKGDNTTPPGGCHFANLDVFRQCVPLFDHKMELEDIDNKIDVTMVFGQASMNDIGSSMHNLTSRFYKNEWSIPQLEDCKLAVLSEQLFSSLPKSGFEPMRRGGSSGIAVPDKDFFAYLRQHRGSSPRLTSAVKFIQRKNTSWQMHYVTPYKSAVTVACPPSMAAPRHGGQIKITHKNIVGYEELFKRFVYVRALTGCLLQVINKEYKYSVVPGAVVNQLAQNERARNHSDSADGRVAYLINACSFTLVAHPVGNHTDIVQGLNGSKGFASSSREFIENRLLLRSPAHSTGDKNDSSVWRGGGGRGIAVYAIVDHPRRFNVNAPRPRLERLTEALSRRHRVSTLNG
jgi:hypothetical protein